MKRKTNRAIVFLIGMLPLTHSAVFGQDTPVPTLAEYLEYIEARNPAIAAARLRHESALQRAQVADTLPDPELAVGFFVESVETRVGPQEQRLSLMQMLPWKGKRRLKRVQEEAMANALYFDLDQTRRAMRHAFARQYAEYYYLGRSIEITNNHADLLKDLQAVITIKYESGTAPYASLIRVEVEIDRLTDRQVTLEQLSEAVRAQMNALLNRVSGEPIPFPDQLPALNWRKDGNNWLSNPQVRRLDQVSHARRAMAELASLRRKPDFKVGLDWIRTGEAQNPALAGSGDDPIVLMVGINLPIWRKSIKAHERAALTDISEVEQSLLQKTNDLNAQWERALFDREDAVRKINLYQQTVIPKATESLSVLETAYQAEESSYLDVIDAERVLLEFDLSLKRAEADRLMAEADLTLIAGQTDPAPLGGSQHD